MNKGNNLFASFMRCAGETDFNYYPQGNRMTVPLNDPLPFQIGTITAVSGIKHNVYTATNLPYTQRLSALETIQATYDHVRGFDVFYPSQADASLEKKIFGGKK